MDNIKESFKRVKKDIERLKQQNLELNKNLIETREKIIELCLIIKKLNKNVDNSKGIVLKNILATQTDKQIISTSPTYSSTHDLDFKPSKEQNRDISTGNEGVPTDRQTHRQTHRQTENNKDNFENALSLLDSLDSLKKELRLQFKKLTEQEMLVFSTLYQIEEEKDYCDYKILAKTLNLTESSIRDYIGRLIKKGIPVEKKKINNKTIHLFISKNLKKIATLPTILQLREL